MRRSRRMIMRASVLRSTLVRRMVVVPGCAGVVISVTSGDLLCKASESQLPHHPVCGLTGPRPGCTVQVRGAVLIVWVCCQSGDIWTLVSILSWRGSSPLRPTNAPRLVRPQAPMRTVRSCPYYVVTAQGLMLAQCTHDRLRRADIRGRSYAGTRVGTVAG